MRRVVYKIRPDEGAFGCADEQLRAVGATPRAIHDVSVLDDETVTLLIELRGDQDRVRKLLDHAGDIVLDYDLMVEGDRIMLHVHYVPDDLDRKLFLLHYEFGILPEYPIRFVEPSSPCLEVTQIGPNDELQELLEYLPEEVDVTIEQIERFEPLDSGTFDSLTARQQEVLLTAIDRGYYDTPREATYEDIATELDCSPSAVGQVLRRIERRLLTDVIRSGHSDPVEV